MSDRNTPPADMTFQGRLRILASSVVLLSSCGMPQPAGEGAMQSPRATEVTRPVGSPEPVLPDEASRLAHQRLWDEEAPRWVAREAHDPRQLFPDAEQEEFEVWDDYASRLAKLSHDGWFVFEGAVEETWYHADEEIFRIVFPGLFSVLDQAMHLPIVEDAAELAPEDRQNVFGTRVKVDRTVASVHALNIVNWNDVERWDPRLTLPDPVGSPVVYARVQPEKAVAAKSRIALRFVVEIAGGVVRERIEKEATFRSPSEVDALFQRLPVHLIALIVLDAGSREVLDVIPAPPVSE